MSWLKGQRGVVTLVCSGCKEHVCFEQTDLRHYAHDVDGNNVYVLCPNCSLKISFYQQAVSQGWVEP